ncbi:hypothetical protein DVK02_11010 [Halobellus sp. Atlit-31R]|nr:hypothetical protein DVK02_11010 [Halobellus sp. Atlit-31R]
MSKEPDQTRSKVGRLIQEYEMNGVGQELEDRWLGRDYERQSLRSLADWFNERLLRAKIEQSGGAPLDGEVANLYRLLSQDDVTAGMRVDAEAALERNDVDPETLQREFVSHQAVHTYLTEFRGVSKEQSTTDRIEKARTTIQRLQSRLIAVIESNLKQLRDSDRLALGEFNILVDVQVLCADCGTSYPITELLDNGGCDCHLDGEE